MDGVRLFFHGMFLQHALQGASVHVEGAGGGGDVAIVFFQHALQVFPSEAFERKWVVFQRGFGQISGGGLVFEKTVQNGVDVGGLGQVFASTQFDGTDGGVDAGIACEDDDFGVGKALMQFWQQLQAAVFAQIQVQNDAIACVLQIQCGGGIFTPSEAVALPFHAAFQQAGKGGIVID